MSLNKVKLHDHKWRSNRALLLAALSLFIASFSSPASADIFGHSEARFFSNTGNVLYLSVGVLLPLLEDGRQGKNHTLRTLDAFGSSLLLSEGLKLTVGEKRPRSNERDSFPSGHTTAAFSVATMESAFHPKQAALWYAGATLIGISRLDLHEHHAQDVIVGALLGYGVARWELSQRRGLILSPVIEPTERHYGINLSARF